MALRLIPPPKREGLSRVDRLSLQQNSRGQKAPALFVHLVARHDAPQVCRLRILRPYLRPLRPVAMPRPRLEIAELLVHAVELGERFGDQSGRTTVVGEQVVADAVP